MTAPDASIRIGYDERAAAQQALDVHMTAGRLDPDEYADRFAAAGVARTQAELDALFTDLPEPHPARPSAPPPGAPRGPNARWREWERYVPASSIGRVVAVVAVTVVVLSLLPFAAAALVLYFVVFPRLLWRGPMWGSPHYRRDCRR
jgi:Domain of unknown function (DUF1707)